MPDSIFCPNCGMLKDNCKCGKYPSKSINTAKFNEDNNSSNSVDLFSFKNHFYF